MRLGILDFSPILKGSSPGGELFDTVRLAQLAESLGYSRYWLTEHHELDTAQHSPETLLPFVVASTQRIRVGVAGILLRLHSPMRVAKSFRVLSTLTPGRIDLGVSGGKASQPIMRAMLGYEPVGDAQRREDFAQRLKELMEFIRDESPLAFNPRGLSAPPIWIHSTSSTETAELAARYGACFGWSLAHPFSQDTTVVVDHYRQHFRPRPEQPQPECALAIAGVCADTEQEAFALAKAYRGTLSGLEVIGTPDQCREKLEAYHRRYNTDDFVLYNLVMPQEARLRSIHLFAKAAGLKTQDLPRAPGH